MEVRYPTDRQQAGMFTVPMWLTCFGWVMWSEPKLTWFCIGMTVVFSPLLYTFGRLAILHLRTRGHVLKWDQAGVAMHGPDGEVWYIPWEQLASLDRRKCMLAEFGDAYLTDVSGNEFDLRVPLGDEFKPKAASHEFWMELIERAGRPAPVHSILVEESKARFRALLGVGCVLAVYTAVAIALLQVNGHDSELVPFWLGPTAEAAANLAILAVTFAMLCRPKKKE